MDVGADEDHFTITGWFVLNGVEYGVFTMNGTETSVSKYQCIHGYTGTWVYGIDRWRCNGSVVVENDGLTLSENTVIVQLMDSATINEISGMQKTLSILLSDRTLLTATGTDNVVVEFNGISVQYPSIGYGHGYCTSIANYSGGNIKIIVAALEPGDHQTLAHQENGVWVPNEVPNYQKQLARCQQYQYYTPPNIDGAKVEANMIAISDTLITGTLHFPVLMKGNPDITKIIIQDFGGNVREFDSSSGYIVIRGPSGITQIKNLPSGTFNPGSWYLVGCVADDNL